MRHQPSWLKRCLSYIYGRPEPENVVPDPTEAIPAGEQVTASPAKQAGTPLNSSTAERADHRIINFINPRTKDTFIGHPVTFMHGIRHASIEAGSKGLLGEDGVWVNDMNMKGEVPWIDDAAAGLFSQTVDGYQGVVGRCGLIDAEAHYFEKVLQVGQNVVIYQLRNLHTSTVRAIGLGRDQFDPLYGLIHRLRQAGKGERPYSPKAVIDLCDRVLQVKPENETALFNKGSALMAEHELAEAHACFQTLLTFQPDDVLATLHDSVVLARLGEDELALEQFLRADEIAPEECKSILTSFTQIRETLESLCERLMLSDGQECPDARTLWRRYFYTSAQSATEPG